MVRSPACLLLDKLLRLYNCAAPPPTTTTETITIVVVVGPKQPRRAELEGLDMATDIKFGKLEQCDVNVKNMKDEDGDTVEWDGPLVWASTDGTISDVRLYEPSGLHVCLGSFEKLGGCTTTGTGDRRKGPEVVPAVITFNITVSTELGDVETYDVEVSEVVPRLDINPL